jgi:hypothetical protein
MSCGDVRRKVPGSARAARLDRRKKGDRLRGHRAGAMLAR